MIRLSRFAPLLAATVAVAFVAVPATADDTKNYFGAGCQKEGTSGTLLVGASGAIYNTHATETLWVQCPIIHDEIWGLTFGGEVVVKDRHYTANISCVLRETNWLTGEYGFVSRTTSGSSLDPIVLDYSALVTLPDDDRDEHYLSLRCSIPPSYSGNNSSLIAYRIDE